VRTALRNGINFIDTAYIYGEGRSEELIGEVLQEDEFDRNQVIIATKAAHRPEDPNKKDNSPEFLTQAVEDALVRLKTNYIDIFYIHFPDEATPKNEAIQALHQLKEAGKIRAIGVSNFSLEQLKEANADGYVDVVEDEYSLIHRQAETELFPYLEEHSISFVPYFPLASGLLTGKYNQETSFAEDDIRSKKPDFQGDRFKKIVATVNQLGPIAGTYDATIPQLVLAWYMNNPAVAAVIPGAKQASQVVDNAQSLDVHLSSGDYQTIDHLFKAFK
jgi:myo-inositol catabolism protein IolS